METSVTFLDETTRTSSPCIMIRARRAVTGRLDNHISERDFPLVRMDLNEHVSLHELSSRVAACLFLVHG